MKRTTLALAAATLISAAYAGSALAVTATERSVWEDLQHSSVNAGHLSISVNNGVATIYGYTDDAYIRNRAERIVRNSEGITDVINLVTTN